jgi:hypothetical protein
VGIFSKATPAPGLQTLPGCFDTFPLWGFAGSRQDNTELRVIAPAETGLLVLIVGDLLLVLRRRLRV